MNTFHEQRREERRKAEGPVRVHFDNPEPVNIEGKLVDLSPSGFRMAHSFVALTAGQVVDFSHPEAEGQARVMWNRVLEEKVETGFLVVAAGK
jgi:hypothetical protein